MVDFVILFQLQENASKHWMFHDIKLFILGGGGGVVNKMSHKPICESSPDSPEQVGLGGGCVSAVVKSDLASIKRVEGERGVLVMASAACLTGP